MVSNAFDISRARCGRQRNRASFEAMLGLLSLHDTALHAVVEIVHKIDLRDALYQPPEVPRGDAPLHGRLLADYTDTELESHGVAQLEGLYDALKGRTTWAVASNGHGAT